MKDRERIGNLEELMAESLMRLDKLDAGQERLNTGQKSLVAGQIELKESVGTLTESMLNLTRVVRKNSNDIEFLKSNMATKDELSIFANEVYVSFTNVREELAQKATKDDLKNFATKDDLKNFATKNDLTNFATEVDSNFKKMRDELDQKATKDDLSKMSTKEGLNNLFDAMMNRFDRSDMQMAEMRRDIDMLKAR